MTPDPTLLAVIFAVVLYLFIGTLVGANGQAKHGDFRAVCLAVVWPATVIVEFFRWVRE